MSQPDWLLVFEEEYFVYHESDEVSLLAFKGILIKANVFYVNYKIALQLLLDDNIEIVESR